MSIQVKFFASLSEKLGLSELEIDQASNAKQVWDIATNGAEQPKNLLVAINLDYADMDSPVQTGDEVAFFPPVTGG